MKLLSFLILAQVLWLGGLVRAEEREVRFAEKHFDFIENYCLDCHDSASEKGKVNLEEIPFKITNIQEAELWQKVLNTLNSGEMPPEKKKQPEQREKADFLDALAKLSLIHI